MNMQELRDFFKINTMANLLQQYENSFSEVNWKAMTRDEQIDFMLRWFALKIFNEKLNKATGQINAENQKIFETQQKDMYINTLKSIGFICNNSIEDYKKLFNRPEIFGEKWQKKAEEAWASSASLDDFINLTMQYLWVQ